MRDYAIPYTTAAASPVQARVHAQINFASRFLPTLHAFLPQHQWFWFDHGRFWTVAELVQTYLGVPSRAWDLGGSAWIDANRFVTATGCVPHVCGADGLNGLLWGDTSASDPWLVFAATYLMAVQHGPDLHLWLFTSRPLDFQKVPANLLLNLQRWTQQENVAKPKDMLLVTIVQPNGQQVDLDWASLQSGSSQKKDNQ